MVNSIIQHLCENNRQSICTHTSIWENFLNKTSTAEHTEIPIALPHGAGIRTSGLHFQHHHDCVQSSYCRPPDYKTSSFSSRASKGKATGCFWQLWKSIGKVRWSFSPLEVGWSGGSNARLQKGAAHPSRLLKAYFKRESTAYDRLVTLNSKGWTHIYFKTVYT